jgi:hypothetical protein
MDFIVVCNLTRWREEEHAPVVIDVLFFNALDVAGELGVPADAFYPAAAAALSVYLQLRSLPMASNIPTKLQDAPLEIPPRRFSSAGRCASCRRSMYVSTTDNAALSRWARPPYDTNGTLVDTFESSDPSFLAGGRALPPVFRVGSLVEAPVRGNIALRLGGTSACHGSTGNPAAAWCTSASPLRQRRRAQRGPRSRQLAPRP